MGHPKVEAGRQEIRMSGKTSPTKAAAYFFGALQAVLLVYICLFDTFKWSQAFGTKIVELSLWLLGFPIHAALFYGLSKNRPNFLLPVMAFYIHSIIDDLTLTATHSKVRSITTGLYVLAETLALISVWRIKNQMQEGSDTKRENEKKESPTYIKLFAFLSTLIGTLALAQFCYNYTYGGKNIEAQQKVFFYNFLGLPAHAAVLYGLVRENTTLFYPFILFYVNNFIANIKVGLTWYIVKSFKPEHAVYSIGAGVILVIVLRAKQQIEARQVGKKAN